MLSASSLMVLALAATPAPAGQSISTTAAARGDVDAILRTVVDTSEEDTYVAARLALAQRRLDDVELLTAQLPGDSVEAAELQWRTARVRRDPARIAPAAARYCALGDRTGRACAEAELYAQHIAPTRVDLPADTELNLAKEAPFPLMLGTTGRITTGVIVDTGASQSVISSQLARQLHLQPTGASFMVGVAGGHGVGEAHMAVVPELKAGKLRVKDLPVLVMDLPELDMIGISAILSPQQALDGLVISIDFQKHKLALRHAPVPAGRVELEVPYVHAGFDLAVPARVGDGPPALFGFDTGMEGGFSLSHTYAGGETTTARTLSIAGAGAQEALAEIAPRTVYLGGAALTPEGPCVASRMKKHDLFQLAGILGNGLWRNRTVTLDTIARRIIVTRAAA